MGLPIFLVAIWLYLVLRGKASLGEGSGARMLN